MSQANKSAFITLETFRKCIASWYSLVQLQSIITFMNFWIRIGSICIYFCIYRVGEGFYFNLYQSQGNIGGLTKLFASWIFLLAHILQATICFGESQGKTVLFWTLKFFKSKNERYGWIGLCKTTKNVLIKDLVFVYFSGNSKKKCITAWIKLFAVSGRSH